MLNPISRQGRDFLKEQGNTVLLSAALLAAFSKDEKELQRIANEIAKLQGKVVLTEEQATALGYACQHDETVNGQMIVNVFNGNRAIQKAFRAALAAKEEKKSAK